MKESGAFCIYVALDWAGWHDLGWVVVAVTRWSDEKQIWDQLLSLILGHTDSSLMVKSIKTEYLLRNK